MCKSFFKRRMCYGGSQGGGGLLRLLLGLLSLVAMAVKNAIMLMDEIVAQLVAVATSATHYIYRCGAAEAAQMNLRGQSLAFFAGSQIAVSPHVPNLASTSSSPR